MAVDHPTSLLQPGSLFAGRYLIERELGHGGMGRVFAVQDRLKGGQRLALKILRSEKFQNAEAGISLAESLRGEFAALVHLRHPNLCSVYDFGVENSLHAYFTLELIDGGDLFDAQPRLDPESLFDVAVGVCRALDYVHARGYLHRDVKPENIMLREGVTGPDAAVLMDFGLAARQVSTTDEPSLSLIGDVHSSSTHRTIRGTINYIAPEVLRGAPYDQRIDLYALGVSLYFAAAGRLPFDAPTVQEVRRQHLTQAPEPPRRVNPRVPPALERLILHLLAKDPAQRFPSANAVIRAVNAWTGRDYAFQTSSSAESFLLAPKAVGREELLTALEEELSAGHSRLIGLEGEAGCGKSRLLTELRSRRQLAGGDLWVFELEGESDPLGELLRRIGHSGLVSRAEQQRCGPVLARRWPPLIELWQVSLSSALGDGGEGGRLMAILAGLLDELGIGIAFDGASGAARQLLLSLRQLCRRTCLLTTDESGLPCERIYRLEPLPREQVQELVQSMLGGTPPLGVSDELYNVAGGSPLFLTETLRQWLESGLLRRERGHWTLDLPAVRRLTVPASIEELSRLRLQRLTPSARQVATLLAIAAWPLTTPALGRLIPRPTELPGALRELEALGMVRFQSGQLVMLTAGHLRRTIRAELDQPEQIHDRLADFLEAQGGDRDALAYHRLYGNDREKALQGGLALVDHLASGGDLSRVQEALERLRQLGGDVCAVELLSSRVARRLGDLTAALNSAQRALELAGPRQLPEAHLALGQAWALQGKHYLALEQLEAAAGYPVDDELAARLAAERLKTYLALGRYFEALKLAQELRRSLEPVSYLGNWVLEHAYAQALLLNGRQEEAYKLCAELADAARLNHDLPGRQQALTDQGAAALCLGRGREGLRLLRQAHLLVLQLREELSLLQTAPTLSLAYILQARPLAGLGIALRAQEQAQRRGLLQGEFESWLTLAELSRWRGELGTALGLLQKAAEQLDHLQHNRLRWRYHFNAAQLRLDLGELDAAGSHLERLEEAPVSLARLVTGRLAWELGEADIALGEFENALADPAWPADFPARLEAAAQLPLLRQEVGQEVEEPPVDPAELGDGHPFSRMLACLAGGELELRRGKFSEAERYADEAERLSRRSGMNSLRWRIVTLRGLLAEARGNAEQRGQCLIEARTLQEWVLGHLPPGGRKRFLARRDINRLLLPEDDRP